uniref:Uncharacterized protein n=1 Tax=Nothobranchius furzeri TaxID=105023 RepID=A0A8C6PMJ0_NOTFU
MALASTHNGALGQLLSMTCLLLADSKVETPMVQRFLNHALLLLTYTTFLCTRLADVKANYVVVKAYQFTTLTSTQLLNCFVTPVLMVLSWFFLKTCYKLVHFVAVMVCLLGMRANVGAFFLAGGDRGSTSDVLLGDSLVLLSACMLYQIYAGEEREPEGVLGMMGLFGTLISVNAIHLNLENKLDNLLTHFAHLNLSSDNGLNQYFLHKLKYKHLFGCFI